MQAVGRDASPRARTGDIPAALACACDLQFRLCGWPLRSALPACVLALALAAQAPMLQAEGGPATTTTGAASAAAAAASADVLSRVDALEKQAEALAPKDPRAAVALAEQAIALLPEDSPRRRRLASGFCLTRVMYGAAEALRIAEAGDAEALAADDRASRARYLACRGYAQEKLEGATSALASYDLGVREAEASADQETIADLYAYRGELLHYFGDYEGAIVDLDASYRLYVEVASEAGQRYALNAMANLYGDPNVGEYERAIDYYNQLLAHDLKSGVESEIATAYFNLGSMFELKGQLDEALEHFRKALEIDSRLGEADGVAQERLSIGAVLRHKGDLPASLDWIEQAMSHYRTERQPDGIARARVQRGRTLAALGRSTEALEDLRAAAAFFVEQDNPRLLATIHGAIADILAASGDWRGAYMAVRAQREAQKVLDARLLDRQTQRLRVQFDAARKEQENHRLHEENQRREDALRSAERVRGLQRLVIILGAALLALLAAMALQQYRRNRRIRRLALTDELTGLPNRRSILGFLDTEWSSRDPGVALSVVAFDVDHFKRINDVCGHAGGDSVLRAVAEILQRELRGGDRVGRTGGEEFVVVLPGTSASAARHVAERLRLQLREHVRVHPPTEDSECIRPVTASFGVSERRSGDRSAADMLKRADDALYRAKREGRDRVVES